MSRRMIAVVGLLFLTIQAQFGNAGDAPGAPLAQIKRIDAQSVGSLLDLLRYMPDPLPIVSAHRGGALRGYPENCIATFEHALRHTHALIEIDPRLTKDGQVVVHHDPTLERTSNGTGLVSEHTLAELQQMRLKDPHGVLTDHQLPSLDDVIEWARGKAVLVLDQKDVPIEIRVRKIMEHQAENHVMVIVYSFQDAVTCYGLDPRIMMEVMIPTREQMLMFDKTGVPWKNVIAFVGHNPPSDKSLFKEIHARGALCMAGTSRNLDKQVSTGEMQDISSLRPQYQAILEMGVDLIETDIPSHVGPLLFQDQIPAGPRGKYFR